MRISKTAALPLIGMLTLLGVAGCADKSVPEDAAIAYTNASAADKCEMRAGLGSSELESCKTNAETQQAGNPSAKTDEDYAQAPEVVRSDDWKEGRLVEVSFQLRDSSAASYAYGMVEEDGSWKVSRFNEIDANLVGREDAACRTLAETELELSECE